MKIFGTEIPLWILIGLVVFLLINLIMGIVGSVYGIRNEPTGRRLAAGVVSITGIFFPPFGIIGGSMAIAWKDDPPLKTCK